MRLAPLGEPSERNGQVKLACGWMLQTDCVSGSCSADRGGIMITQWGDRTAVERWVYTDVGKFSGLIETMDESIKFPIWTEKKGEMEEVVDLTHQIVLVALADTEKLLGQVPGDRHQTALFHA